MTVVEGGGLAVVEGLLSVQSVSWKEGFGEHGGDS